MAWGHHNRSSRCRSWATNAMVEMTQIRTSITSTKLSTNGFGTKGPLIAITPKNYRETKINNPALCLQPYCLPRGNMAGGNMAGGNMAGGNMAGGNSALICDLCDIASALLLGTDGRQGGDPRSSEGSLCAWLREMAAALQGWVWPTAFLQTAATWYPRPPPGSLPCRFNRALLGRLGQTEDACGFMLNYAAAEPSCQEPGI